MTYNEWRDELKSNLLCFSESERRRVLDYYAEAYADRREAGYTENEIINDFGAPYDAAHRILDESHSDYGYRDEPIRSAEPSRREERERSREERRERHEERREDRREDRRTTDREEGRRIEYTDRRTRKDDYFDYDKNTAPPPPPPQPEPRREREGLPMWLFVILCIVLFWPLFGLTMGMVGITVGFCSAPIGMMAGGIADIGAGIGALFSGSAGNGVIKIGEGILIFGIGLILLPLAIKFVKFMWKLAVKLFRYVKSFFGRRHA